MGDILAEIETIAESILSGDYLVPTDVALDLQAIVVRARENNDVPSNVIFVPENGGFYRGTDTGAGLYNGETFMGQDFLKRWWRRRDQFPQDRSPGVVQ